MGENNINLNTVGVVKWTSGSTENNCWWNIARNQLSESASASEILALSERLQEYNKEKNQAITDRGNVLYEGDQIFIPLDFAMDEINANIETLQNGFEEVKAKVPEAASVLDASNIKVSDALNAYNTACENYNSADENSDTEALLNAMTNAKQEYDQALQEQQQAMQALSDTQMELQRTKGDLEAAQKELSELKQEYEEEKENYESELKAVDEHIASLQDKLDNAESNFQDAMAKMKEAQKMQEEALALNDAEAQNEVNENETDENNISENESPQNEDTEQYGENNEEDDYSILEQSVNSLLPEGEIFENVTDNMDGTYTIGVICSDDTQKEYLLNENGELVPVNSNEVSNNTDTNEVSRDDSQTDINQQNDAETSIAIARAITEALAPYGQKFNGMSKNADGIYTISATSTDGSKITYTYNPADNSLNQISSEQPENINNENQNNEVSQEKIILAKATLNEAFDNNKVNKTKLSDAIMSLNDDELKILYHEYTTTDGKSLFNVINQQKGNYQQVLLSRLNAAVSSDKTPSSKSTKGNYDDLSIALDCKKYDVIFKMLTGGDLSDKQIKELAEYAKNKGKSLKTMVDDSFGMCYFNSDNASAKQAIVKRLSALGIE